jgi:hypothetical protein
VRWAVSPSKSIECRKKPTLTECDRDLSPYKDPRTNRLQQHNAIVLKAIKIRVWLFVYMQLAVYTHVLGVIVLSCNVVIER